MKVCVYLVSSILAVFMVLTDVVFQLLDLKLDFIVLLPDLIDLCALTLKHSERQTFQLFIIYAFE